MKIPPIFYLFPVTFVLSLLPVQPSSAGPPLLPSKPETGTCPSGNTAQLPPPPLSQTNLSIPSLWLTKEQFGGKLLEQWFIESGKNWAVLIVNRQIWSLLDYLERYQFIHNFGTVARQYGYNVRVCNRQGATLGVYTCNFPEIPRATTTALSCQITLDSLNNGGLRERRKLF